ncbi:MAG: class I SAM-dependent methyltransferase [Lentisphaerae bacterium]|nr:class I SAM-dependent methyltransferase [Lentisphaerota bacterium]
MRRRLESDFTPPSDICPHPEYWHTGDCETTEQEVVELIGALVRALQPELVVETGSYKGVMSESIGRALKQNGHGRLITFEIDAVLAEVARRACRRLPVEVLHQSSLAWTPPGKIDFAWLDSGIETRVQEFEQYYPFLKGSIIGIHDTAPHHPVRAQVKARLLDRLSPIWLPTPRGVLLAQVL